MPMVPRVTTEDETAIRAVHEAWLDAEKRGDVEGVLALCTDDVRWLGPGVPALQGKTAGRELLRNAAQICSIETSDIRIEGSGGIAYKTCAYHTTYRASADAGVEVARGKHLWVLHKVESTWQVALVMWQPDVAA